MNSKPTKYFMMMICVFVLTSSGCSDDPAGPEEPATIIGTWQLTRLETTVPPGETTICEGECLGVGESYTFNEDGSGINEDSWGEVQITWEIQSDGDLYMYYLDGDTRSIFWNWTVSACTLRVEFHWTDGRDTVEIYTRSGGNCS